MNLRRRRYLGEGNESPIDGKTKKSAINYIYKIVGRTNDGFFNDEYWRPIKKTFAIMDKGDIPYVLQDSSYEHEKGIPIRKRWKFEIHFLTGKDRKKAVIYGILTAAGAGSVDDPLSKYDVTLVLQ